MSDFNVNVTRTGIPAYSDGTSLEDQQNASQGAATLAGGVNRSAQQIIIDVKSGNETLIAGLQSNIIGKTNSATAAELTTSQAADLERLLGILGLDVEDAKSASTLTVLQAIQKHIKAQGVIMTKDTKALSAYDLERLDSLKQALSTLENPTAAEQKIIDNVGRMRELSANIEYLANEKGLEYDGKFEEVPREKNPNFALNTDVREIGDRIGDIRHYNASVNPARLEKALSSLAPATAQAVRDLLGTYAKTSGWGISVTEQYSRQTNATLSSFINVLKSPDLTLPDSVDREALVKMLEKLEENAKTADEIEKKLEELIAELEETLAQVEAGRLDAPETV